MAVQARTEQLSALSALNEDPKRPLSYELDPQSGVTRTLLRHGSYLSERSSDEPQRIARRFLAAHVVELGLNASDLDDMELTDATRAPISGTHHLFFRQRHAGVPVHNGQIQVHVNREGKVLRVNNNFVPDLAQVAPPAEPSIGAAVAVESVAQHLGVDMLAAPDVRELKGGTRAQTLLEAPELSRSTIKAELMWLPVQAGEVRLVWNFAVETTDGDHFYDMVVDADEALVWLRFDWTAGDSYRVFPRPLENPDDAGGQRQLVSNPADATASPFGWHATSTQKYATMRGNNVYAYEDSDSNNKAPTTEPTCGASLVCDFAADFAAAPSTYKNAAVANLFYWNNTIHDVLYRYGFNEQNGNFQDDNNSNGGKAADAVRAEAQDGSGTNNANFSTPPDGSPGRMQMYVWNQTSPSRDGDFDSGIVIHEYGHGVSTRQVGGPSNSSCLSNKQQAGEGWSDLLALVFTAKKGDAGKDWRAMGNYALGEGPSGKGIRTQPYSTDPAINTHTYESIKGKAVPHGVGEVWAQAGWEMYWALVDKYGFSEDLGTPGSAGNQRALLYINEGLQNTACRPTFVNNRDGILAAAQENFNGEDVCLIWKTFAGFGLGANAVSGDANATTPTNGFALPDSCNGGGGGENQAPSVKITSPTDGSEVPQGGSVTLSGAASDPEDGDVSKSIAWTSSLDGALGAGSPLTVKLSSGTHVLTAAARDGNGATASAKISVRVLGTTTPPAGFTEDFETGSDGWTSTGLWHAVASSSCAVKPPKAPGLAYFGADASCSYATGARVQGNLTSPVINIANASTNLSFAYFRKVEGVTKSSWDRARVEVVSGSTSTVVFDQDSTKASATTWQQSGNISLGSYAGKSIQLRFVFDSVDAQNNAFTGWMIDDVRVGP